MPCMVPKAIQGAAAVDPWDWCVVAGDRVRAIAPSGPLLCAPWSPGELFWAIPSQGAVSAPHPHVQVPTSCVPVMAVAPWHLVWQARPLPYSGAPISRHVPSISWAAPEAGQGETYLMSHVPRSARYPGCEHWVCPTPALAPCPTLGLPLPMPCHRFCTCPADGQAGHTWHLPVGGACGSPHLPHTLSLPVSGPSLPPWGSVLERPC